MYVVTVFIQKVFLVFWFYFSLVLTRHKYDCIDTNKLKTKITKNRYIGIYNYTVVRRDAKKLRKTQ